MAGGQNDILWKGMLEAVFDDFLRFVFPQSDKLLNVEWGFEDMNNELAEIKRAPERSDTRIVDKLIKVYQKSDREKWIFCHIEVQGRNQRLFPGRMFRYYCRIAARHDRPITAIAIFTGKGAKSLKSTYIRQCMGAKCTYQYNTLCILDYTDKWLAENRNPFALVILAAKKALLRGEIPDEDLLKEKLQVAKLLIDKGYEESKTNAILSFIYNYIRLKDPGINRVFEKELDGLTGKTNTMGIIEQVKQMKIDAAREEARKKARKEEKIETIKRMLALGYSAKNIAIAAGVTVPFVERKRNRKV